MYYFRREFTELFKGNAEILIYVYLLINPYKKETCKFFKKEINGQAKELEINKQAILLSFV